MKLKSSSCSRVECLGILFYAVGLLLEISVGGLGYAQRQNSSQFLSTSEFCLDVLECCPSRTFAQFHFGSY